MWFRTLRFHYAGVWLLILALAQWRLGMPRAGLDDVLVIAMQVLCFPAGIFAAVMLAFVPVAPGFWDTRVGSIVGWAVLFTAGFVQWFVVASWVVRKVRKRPEVSGQAPDS